MKSLVIRPTQTNFPHGDVPSCRSSMRAVSRYPEVGNDLETMPFLLSLRLNLKLNPINSLNCFFAKFSLFLFGHTVIFYNSISIFNYMISWFSHREGEDEDGTASGGPVEGGVWAWGGAFFFTHSIMGWFCHTCNIASWCGGTLRWTGIRPEGCPA